MRLEHRRRRHGMGKVAVWVGNPVNVEAGRTDDLFAFREFGSASENEIVTILVAEKDADKVFDIVCKKAGLTEPQSGLVYQMPLHKKSG